MIASKYRPDVVWAWFATTAGYVAAISKLHPTVLTVLGSDVLTAEANAFRRFRAQMALAHADVITTTTPITTDFRQALDNLGVDERKIISTAWGVDEHFRPGDKLAARRIVSQLAPDVKPDSFVILSLRDAKPNYRQAELLVGFAQARGALPASAHLIIFLGNGNVSYMSELERTANLLGLSGRVSFIKRSLTSEEMHCLYVAADVGVSIPTSDRVGGPIIEFVLSGGSCLLLARLTSYLELLGNRPGLVYLEGTSATEIALGLIRCARNQAADLVELRGRLAEMFSWTRAANDVIMAFERGISLRRKTRSS